MEAHGVLSPGRKDFDAVLAGQPNANSIACLHHQALCWYKTAPNRRLSHHVSTQERLRLRATFSRIVFKTMILVAGSVVFPWYAQSWSLAEARAVRKEPAASRCAFMPHNSQCSRTAVVRMGTDWLVRDYSVAEPGVWMAEVPRSVTVPSSIYGRRSFAGAAPPDQQG